MTKTLLASTEEKLGIRIRIFQPKDYHAVRKLFEKRYFTAGVQGSPPQMARDRLRQLPVTYLTYVLLGAGTLVFASTIPVFPWAPWTLRFPIDINSTLGVSHSSSSLGLTTTSWVSSSLPPFLRSIPCDTITITTLLRVLGTVLVLVSSFFFFYLRRLVLKAFTNYTRESLEGDMKDIIEFYKLKEAAPVADSTKEKEDSIPIPIPIPERQWEPSGTKAFWVAELIGSGEIVGCIALDTPSRRTVNPRPSTLPSLPPSMLSALPRSQIGELRRMTVSGRHRRLGIGKALIRTLLAHARERGVKVVMLGTTEYHAAALATYERYGWEYAKEREMVFQMGWGMPFKIVSLWVEVERAWGKVNT